jgi:hypothetical protein
LRKLSLNGNMRRFALVLFAIFLYYSNIKTFYPYAFLV